MGSSLNWGPFLGPCVEGCRTVWETLKRDPNLENYRSVSGASCLQGSCWEVADHLEWYDRVEYKGNFRVPCGVLSTRVGTQKGTLISRTVTHKPCTPYKPSKT